MSENLDKVQELAKILEERANEGYSDTAIDHGHNPRNLDNLYESNAFSLVTGPCGDTMAMWLGIEDDKITNVGFTTDGCMASLAAGSMITEIAKGKNLIDAQKISQQDVLDALGGLPEEKEHRALLWVNTLREAIENYRTEAGNT